MNLYKNPQSIYHFKLDFFENEASYGKILFSFFNLFLHVESLSDRLFYDLKNTLYQYISIAMGIINSVFPKCNQHRITI